MLLTNYRKTFLSQLSIEGTWPAKGSGRAEEGEWGGEELPHNPSLVHTLKSINLSVYPIHPIEEKP